MDIRLALMTGIDIPIPECQLVIHQPKIIEISYIGEEDFLKGIQSFNINLNMLEDKSFLENSNNFQIFMTIMTQNETADKKEAVLQLFQLLFPKYKIVFLPKTLVFTSEGQQPIMIDESNFDFMQDMIKTIFCLNSSLGSQEQFNPADEKAREIAEKLMRGRQRVAAQKGGGSGSFLAQYISILTVGLNAMSLNDILNLTLYQMYDLIERYQLFAAWDIDIRVRMAGGTPNETQDNWMKNIH